MADNRSVLFMNIDQSKNKYSKLPKTATQYYLYPYGYVRIWIGERKEERIILVSQKKMKLIKKFTDYPGGGRMRLRKKTSP